MHTLLDVLTGRVVIHTTDNEEDDALWYAAWYRNISAVSQLVAKGANVNRGNNDGFTELHAASGTGHIRVPTTVPATTRSQASSVPAKMPTCATEQLVKQVSDYIRRRLV